MVKNPPAMQAPWVQSLGWKDPWRRAWQPTPVFLPRESHGQRSPAGCSPYGHKELGTTKWLTLSLFWNSSLLWLNSFFFFLRKKMHLINYCKIWAGFCFCFCFLFCFGFGFQVFRFRCSQAPGYPSHTGTADCHSASPNILASEFNVFLSPDFVMSF